MPTPEDCTPLRLIEGYRPTSAKSVMYIVTTIHHSYALLHLGNIQLDMRLKLEILFMRGVHLLLNVVLQIRHLQKTLATHFSAAHHERYIPSSRSAQS
jgi:hypothetical protein